MSDSHLTDREVELILAGSPTGSEDLADLERFVAGMSKTSQRRDAEHMATALAATARSARKTRGLRRMATIAASAALLVAMSGVAMAADGAAPGDALYGIDRALETIGIGDGGLDERLGEFDFLLHHGEEERALEFLDEVITTSPEADATVAQQHLEAAVNDRSTAREDNGRNEQALGSSPGQAESTEHRPENQGQSDVEPATEPGGRAVSHDDHPQPPGEEKSDEVRTEPDTAGPKDDTSQPDHFSSRNDNDPPGQNKRN